MKGDLFVKKILLVILSLILVVSSVSFLGACSSKPEEPASEGSNVSANTESKSDSGDSSDKVVFGVTAALSGKNKMNGEFVQRGADLAAKIINERGGILGKELVLVYEDEIDTLQDSINAMTKLLNNDEVMGVFGSVYTANVIGISPTVLEKQVPFYCGDSSVNELKGDNPYYWQARMTADKTAIIFAKTVDEVLEVKNPAIMYVTDSFGTQAKDNTLRELSNRGIEVKEENIYGFDNDEQNYTPILTQIINSDCDGLLAFGHQMPAALICQQADAAGLDIPRIGSSSWASAICRINAGPAADGWYGIADWTDEITTESGKAFYEAYFGEYGEGADMPAATAYDSIMLFAKACEIANTTTDRNAINDAMKEIKDLQGAMSPFNYNGTSSLSSVQLCTLNENGKAKMLEAVPFE